MKGLFITLEGGDGAGKSTQIRNIERFFSEKGLVVVHTREPGGTAISEKLRDILLDNQNTEMTAWNEDYEYTDWQWWLARSDGGKWKLVEWGY